MTEQPDWAEIHIGLCATFPEDEIKQRPGRRGGPSYDYIDARAVMNRLDAVVGPENWSNAFRIIDSATAAVECTITVCGIPKADVGYPNSPVGSTDKSGNPMSDEPFKDAFSDAFKRAAVHWGIGRFLYDRGKPARAATTNEQPAARSGGGWQDKPASDAQREYAMNLLTEHGQPMPENPEAMTTAQAKAIIEELKDKQVDRSGFPPREKSEPRGPYPPGEAAQAMEDNPAAAVHAERIKSAGKVSPEEGASSNQRATLTKLSRLLGEPEKIDEGMTYAAAADRITELSRQYNEQQSWARKSQAQETRI